MSNKDLWELHVSHDMDQVQKLLQKGYTETSEFEDKVELLISSLEYFLRDAKEVNS